MQIKIGIIGGTGVGEEMAAAVDVQSNDIETVFGPPSSSVLVGKWEGADVAFINRHGPGHTIPPTLVPFRANVMALKMLGVTHVLATGAVGSLREEIEPRHLVVPDQVIDKTFKRDKSFFDDRIAVHTDFAEPFCGALRKRIIDVADHDKTPVHPTGTYVCMEGPQFSTVAESRMHRAWGGDLIGMTCMPEAKLAREAEMCYGLICLPTDYDCWRPHDPNMDKTALIEEIMGHLKVATENALALLRETVRSLGEKPLQPCACHDALAMAIWSDKSKVDRALVSRLRPILGRHFADASAS